MRLKEIGEFGLINKIRRATVPSSSVYRGIGDDAAVLKWTNEKYLLATIDMLIEDRHFRRNAMPDLVGWKSVCCGVSDIAAMGGLPKWALVSCGLPKNLDAGYVNGIYKGISSAARRFGLDLVGGDTNSSDKIILDVAVLGEAKKNQLVLRSGARKGDFIFVTGELGGSIKGRHLKFMPRLKESQALVKNFRINAMIDLSDGLSSDLGHILEESNAGAVIYEELIPRSKQAKSVENALSDGEDFELLFTMSKEEGARLLAAKGRMFNTPVTRIGTIVDIKLGANIVNMYGARRQLKPLGFKHF